MGRAKEVLDERLARGEITVAEYDALAKQMATPSSAASRPLLGPAELRVHGTQFWVLMAAFSAIGFWFLLILPKAIPLPPVGGTAGQAAIALVVGYGLARLFATMPITYPTSLVELVQLPFILGLAVLSIVFSVWGAYGQGISHPGSLAFFAAISAAIVIALPWVALKIGGVVSPDVV